MKDLRGMLLTGMNTWCCRNGARIQTRTPIRYGTGMYETRLLCFACIMLGR